MMIALMLLILIGSYALFAALIGFADSVIRVPARQQAAIKKTGTKI